VLGVLHSYVHAQARAMMGCVRSAFARAHAALFLGPALAACCADATGEQAVLKARITLA